MQRLGFVSFLSAVLVLQGIGFSSAQVSEALPKRLALLVENQGTLANFRRWALPELARLGFQEGRNLVLELRQSSPERMSEAASEVVASKPDAIFAVGNFATVAAKAATSTIPIVVFGGNPVDLGLATSLSRPGGNITAVVILGRELNAKRLELLHQALPTAKRLAALVEPSASANAYQREMDEVAAGAGIELLFFFASGSEDYEAAFDGMRSAGAQGLAISSSPNFNRHGALLAHMAAEAGLPTICQWRELAEQGCYLSYGPSLSELYLRNAEYVARVLKGDLPGNMPIEQPSKFEFVVNLRTGKALGLTIPPTLLARADEVIE